MSYYNDPHTRGMMDSYYRRPHNPHKRVNGKHVTELTEKELAEYNKGWEYNESIDDYKDYS